jgi:DNA repair exonuclease SbcCD ATPase subunit
MAQVSATITRLRAIEDRLERLEQRLEGLDERLESLDHTTSQGFKALAEVSEIQTSRLLAGWEALAGDLREALALRPKVEDLDRRLAVVEARR